MFWEACDLWKWELIKRFIISFTELSFNKIISCSLQMYIDLLDWWNHSTSACLWLISFSFISVPIVFRNILFGEMNLVIFYCCFLEVNYQFLLEARQLLFVKVHYCYLSKANDNCSCCCWYRRQHTHIWEEKFWYRYFPLELLSFSPSSK